MRCADDLQQKVLALGARFDAAVNEATRAIYRDHVDLRPAGKETLDVPYGEHPRHRLDVYRPNRLPRGTVVFVHGGGFVGGDKNSDGVFYVNVGRWLARNGWTAVVPNYRLAPEANWPAGLQDVSAVLRWVRSNEGELEAAGAPLVLWGQSAGACHVASWLFDATTRPDQKQRLSAVMLVSGFYEVRAPLAAGLRAYFGTDAEVYRRRSPLAHVSDTGVPIWLGLAELDPPEIAQHTYALANALSFAVGSGPGLHMFRGHNHVSTVQGLGSPHDDAGTEILRVLQALVAPSPLTSPEGTS